MNTSVSTCFFLALALSVSSELVWLAIFSLTFFHFHSLRVPTNLVSSRYIGQLVKDNEIFWETMKSNILFHSVWRLRGRGLGQDPRWSAHVRRQPQVSLQIKWIGILCLTFWNSEFPSGKQLTISTILQLFQGKQKTIYTMCLAQVCFSCSESCRGCRTWWRTSSPGAPTLMTLRSRLRWRGTRTSLTTGSSQSSWASPRSHTTLSDNRIF